MAERIVVNTATLASYAPRIQNVINRLSWLNTRIRNLYYTGRVSGIYSFVRSNRFYEGINALADAKTYINGTVSDLEWIENHFSEVDPLHFTEAQGVGLQLVNSKDRLADYLSEVDFQSIFDALLRYTSLTGIAISGIRTITALVTAGKEKQGIENVDADDIISDILQTGDFVGSLQSETYDWWMEILLKSGVILPQEAAKINDSFVGKGSTVLSVIGTLMDLTDSACNTQSILTDAYSTFEEKLAACIGVSGDAVCAGDNIFMAVMRQMKEVVSVGRHRNQILDTGAVEWDYKNPKIVNNVNAALVIVTSYLQAAESGLLKYAEVSADGDVDMGDAGKIGVSFGTNGLFAMVDTFCCGGLLPNEWGTNISTYLEEDFSKKGAQNLCEYDWYWDYVEFDGNTWTNNCVTRFGASVGATAMAMGETAVEEIVRGAVGAYDWVKGWFD